MCSAKHFSNSFKCNKASESVLYVFIYILFLKVPSSLLFFALFIALFPAFVDCICDSPAPQCAPCQILSGGVALLCYLLCDACVWLVCCLCLGSGLLLVWLPESACLFMCDLLFPIGRKILLTWHCSSASFPLCTWAYTYQPWQQLRTLSKKA